MPLRLGLALTGLISAAAFAQQPPTTTAPSDEAQQVLERERLWAAAIMSQDPVATAAFLDDGYFLGIAVEGAPLAVVPRAGWLETLKTYRTESFAIDDARVHVYGDTAVVLMLCTQKATVRGQDRSGQFAITDIWIKGPAGWRVAERHSARPEPKPVARP